MQLKRRLKKNIFGNKKRRECITFAVTEHIPVICKKKKKAKQLQQTVTKERNKVRLNKELFAQ